jgi:phenylacetate-CoA ligase
MMSLYLGRLIAKYGNVLRPSYNNAYKKCRRNIEQYNAFTNSEREQYIFSKVYNITNFAINRVPFYKEFYEKCGFKIEHLKSFDDIRRIPIINKSILQEYTVEKRISDVTHRYLMNTGGSSGNPLSFYVGRNFMSNEWAHIHYAWESIGYNKSNARLCITGRQIAGGVKFDILRNNIGVNMYVPFSQLRVNLMHILSNAQDKSLFLYGYPSTLFEFANYCNTQDSDLLEIVRRKIKGILLGSEFPYPHFRNAIESIIQAKTLSWYGHSEGCILAHEQEYPYVFCPLQTYGYAEAEKVEEGYTLIGTSYSNYVFPFIRYDTEDIVDDLVKDHEILGSFQIKKGRKSEYIIDTQNLRISLTGLIFGRHHKLFNHVLFIQVKQEKTGSLIVYYVPKEKRFVFTEDLFDKSQLELDFEFREISQPIRTSRGKVNLLLKDEDME